VSKTIEYERMIDEEEQSIVHKATEIEMTELKTGKNKTYLSGNKGEHFVPKMSPTS